MKYFCIALFFLMNLFIPAYSENQGMLIFLDDSEEFVAAITSDLLVALSQKPGPILASTSLLKNIFLEYNGEYKTASAEKLESGNIVLVNKIKVKYNSADLSIPGLSSEEEIMLSDVVFDKIEGPLNIYYTYKGEYFHNKERLAENYREQILQAIRPSAKLTFELSPETKKLEEALGKRLPKNEKEKEMSSNELRAAILNLSPAKRALGLEFVFALTTKEKDMANLKNLIFKLKQNDLINAILPLRFVTPLALAVQSNADREIIELLFASGAKANKAAQPLVSYAISAHAPLEILTLLQKQGARIDKNDLIIHV